MAKSGYSEKGVSRNTYTLSDATQMIWYDQETSGGLVVELNSNLRSIYADIFVNKYPLEITCKIRRNVPEKNIEYSIGLGDKLEMLNNIWTTTKVKMNSTGFYYDISAYKIGPIEYSLVYGGTASADSRNGWGVRAEKAFDY